MIASATSHTRSAISATSSVHSTRCSPRTTSRRRLAWAWERAAWVAKCDDDAGGTNIAFAQSPDQANASPPETPMDWLPAASSPGPFGSEYEIFPADSAYNDTDPATTFTSPFVADPQDARPRNVPGARILWWIPGITASPP